MKNDRAKMNRLQKWISVIALAVLGYVTVDLGTVAVATHLAAETWAENHPEED